MGQAHCGVRIWEMSSSWQMSWAPRRRASSVQEQLSSSPWLHQRVQQPY